MSFLQTGAGLERHLVSKALQVSGKGHDRLGISIMDIEGAGDFRMVSTHGLLALLSRWAFAPMGSGGLERPGDKQSASLCLSALIGLIMPGDFTMFLSAQSFSEQGWPTGSRLVALHGTKDGLRLFPLTQVRHRLCIDICERFPQARFGEDEVVSFCDLFKGTINAPIGSSLGCFFKQLVQGLGKMVDLKVRDEVAPLRDAAMLDVSSRESDKMLVKYWAAMRETFVNPLVLHMALDQGNLGKKPTVCGMMAVPGNVGAIFPPQVVHERNGGGGVFGSTAAALS